MGMESLNDMFFTSAGKEALTYDQILEDVQKYCTEKHADKLSGEGARMRQGSSCGNSSASTSSAAPTI